MVVPSQDSAEPPSENPLLIGGPRFTGVDQAPEVVVRVETQMSLVPIEPLRFDETNISKPSRLMAVRPSPYRCGYCGFRHFRWRRTRSA